MQREENRKMNSLSLTAKRGIILLILVAIIGFGACTLRVLYLSVIGAGKYREKAENQQLSVKSVAANRGTIYDSNMKILAQSAAVWLVYINPSKITEDTVKDDGTIKQGNKNLVINGLSNILGLDAEKLKAAIEERKSYGYYKVKGKVELAERNALLTYIKDNGLGDVIFMDPDTKRYYPNSELASTLMGFTGTDGNGLFGLEYYYDDILTGTNGRIITTKNGRQSEMPNSHEETIEAHEGINLVLAVNSEIQTILQDALKTALKETNAKNVYGIVMETKTGAVLAAANLPDYNPNSPYEVLYPELVEYFKENGTDAEKEEPDKAARGEQWINKSFSAFYHPGSVYKVFLVSGALEEGVITPETTYNCTGTIQAAGRTIKDYYTTGHGVETPSTLLINSCNCFSVYVGQKMGTDLYYKYFEAFGFTEKTGVDSSGDMKPKAGVTYHDPDVSFTSSDLASASFGQSVSVTPLQIITAVSAIGNGGKLMRPYIVSKQTDKNGNTVKETKPQVRRQVVSESTASKVSSYMNLVVKKGTGKNAYVPGYKVAGKTGTSEKLDKAEKAYIASFAGFAPYDDPDISVVIIIDEPQGANYSGGVIAAPVAGEVFEKVLKYRGIAPVFSDDELASMTVSMPNVVGNSVEDAKKTLEADGYTVRVIGNGDSVVSQTPEEGKSTPANGFVAVYTEDGMQAEKVRVPDFTGMTVSQVTVAAVNGGLNVRISGSSSESAGVAAYKQDKDADTEVDAGTVITVYFRTTSGVHD